MKTRASRSPTPRRKKTARKKSTRKKSASEKKSATPRRDQPAAMLVTASQLGRVLGLSRKAISEARANGIFPGAEGERYPLGESVQSYFRSKLRGNSADELAAARVRLAQTKAKAAELEYLERSGAVIDLREVQAALDDLSSKVGQELGQIGESVALDCINEADPDIVAQIIQAAIDAARSRLADYCADIHDTAPGSNGHAMGGL